MGNVVGKEVLRLKSLDQGQFNLKIDFDLGLPVSKHFETHEVGGPKRMKYSDITFIEKWFVFSRILVFDRLTDESFWQIEFRNEDGTHDRIIIDIENGPKFLISAKVRKGSMSFGIMDIHGMYFLWSR